MKKSLPLSILFCLIFFSKHLIAQQDSSSIQLIYIQLEIKGMACSYCAFGMEKELLNLVGVDTVNIELKEGLVYISTPVWQKPTKERLIKLIEDAGFTAGEIVFQTIPFERLKGN